MAFHDRRTPGVYITELSAFPPSVVGVQTAVPAFIGYTQKAEISGKPVYMKPIKIGSLADFEEIFGFGYEPTYLIKAATDKQIADRTYDFQVLKNGTDIEPEELYYTLQPKETAQFNLHNSLRLFYANGGGNCYVVSVGRYKSAQESAELAKAEAQQKAETSKSRESAARSRAVAARKEAAKSDNPEARAAAEAKAAEADAEADQAATDAIPTPVSSVKLQDLLDGLAVIRDQSGPTMLVVPEGVLLPGSDPAKLYVSSDFGTLVQKMLEQCAALQDRVAVLDVYGSDYATKTNLEDLESVFRAEVGQNFLNYGMSYFPFLYTNIVGVGEYTYENLDKDATPSTIQDILGWENYNLYFDKKNPAGDGGKRYVSVKQQIDNMYNPGDISETVDSLNQNLTVSLPLLADIERILTAKNDTLPPSPAMAGIYTFVDATRGVWNAPANISLSSVVRPTFKVDDGQQADLNMPIEGKAINAIREFTGRGTLVWGARTLDGNSNDYRYIQVRRTLIYIEQSIKAAINGFVFAANDGNTWVTITAMVSNFLQDLWARGGLMGATASEAFDVQCGLGSTMTPTDILQGYMIVQVRVQLLRPAEFIELTFKQKMEGIS